MKRLEANQKLAAACERATGGGVGYQHAIRKDGTVVIRRDEEYAVSHDTEFESVEDALEFLRV